MKTVLILTAGAVILSACASLQKRNVETVIDIPASRGAVWEALTNVEGHANWNPFIINMEGEIGEGLRLKNTMSPSPGQSMVFKPKILKVEQNRELRWLGRFLLPGLFDGEHYFILEDSLTGTKLTHGENFKGLGLLFTNVQKFEKNFDQMNRALLDQVVSKSTIQ